MKNVKAFTLFFFFFICAISVSGQNKDSINHKKKWFASIDLGIQMSGIKSEDFISSNYSPLLRIIGGKWLNKKIGIQIGYQGRYFNAIADNDKHFYDFYFSEVVFNAKNILLSENKDDRLYDLLFHVGLGYFQNHYYGNSTVHGVLGASNNFLISDRIKIKFDIGAIVGWDIYQGDDDILPSISFGLVYNFNKI
ncbi:MAG: hypothetical protein AB8B78_00460 [Polaribacter sp.]